MSMLLKNAKQLLPNNEVKACDVFIDKGKIKQIGENLSIDSEEVIDCGGQFFYQVLLMCISICASRVENIKKQSKLAHELLQKEALQQFVRCQILLQFRIIKIR